MDRWCQHWDQPRGAVISLEQQWGLATAWYNDRLEPDWRRKTDEEVVAVFSKLGLTSPFWDLPD